MAYSGNGGGIRVEPSLASLLKSPRFTPIIIAIREPPTA